jgi:hypothetical protein
VVADVETIMVVVVDVEIIMIVAARVVADMDIRVDTVVVMEDVDMIVGRGMK